MIDRYSDYKIFSVFLIIVYSSTILLSGIWLEAFVKDAGRLGRIRLK